MDSASLPKRNFLLYANPAFQYPVRATPSNCSGINAISSWRSHLICFSPTACTKGKIPVLSQHQILIWSRRQQPNQNKAKKCIQLHEPSTLNPLMDLRKPTGCQYPTTAHYPNDHTSTLSNSINQDTADNTPKSNLYFSNHLRWLLTVQTEIPAASFCGDSVNKCRYLRKKSALRYLTRTISLSFFKKLLIK